MSKNQPNDRVYLDYAAASPVRDEVLKAMQPYWQDRFANPQSQHAEGRTAKQAVSSARQTIAKTLSVQPSEIIFTSGATEANTLAVKGVCKSEDGQSVAAISAGNHPSLLAAEEGKIDVRKLPLQSSGRIESAALDEKISSDTSVVSVPYVNSAVGSVEKLREISNQLNQTDAVFHTDASQAGNFLPLEPEPLGVDMMTINSHKLYGPKGVGLLWVRSGTPLTSVFLSENGHAVGDYQMLRPGTPPVPLIVGFAKAVSMAQNNYKKAKKRVRKLRDYAIEGIQELSADITLNGSRKQRVANNIHISIAGVDHDYIATKLNQEGVSVATTTACQSEGGGSVMLENIPDTPNSGLRITLGLSTDKEDVDDFIAALRAVIAS